MSALSSLTSCCLCANVLYVDCIVFPTCYFQLSIVWMSKVTVEMFIERYAFVSFSIGWFWLLMLIVVYALLCIIMFSSFSKIKHGLIELCICTISIDLEVHRYKSYGGLWFGSLSTTTLKSKHSCITLSMLHSLFIARTIY